MSKKIIAVLAICMFAVAAFGQATSQDPTYPAGTTKGKDIWGATPSGSKTIGTPGGTMDTGYAFAAGQQFNSKWKMVNGNHDLTTNASNINGAVTWSTGTVKASALCGFCHTAHDNESEFATRTWLWAHETAATYQVYSSPTLQSTPTADASSQTAMCLGCHDGTLAVSAGNYGTPGSSALPQGELQVAGTAITASGKLTSAALIVPTERTHPVSFTYDATLAGKHQLRVPVKNSVDGFGIVPLFGPNGDQMECATCHDPHIGSSGIMRRQFPTGATQDAGTGSFCMYCHL